MIAHSYIRFSDPNQARGGSLQRQRQMIAEHVTAKGWIAGEEYFDSGLSASKGHHLEEGAALHRFEQEALNGDHIGAVLVVERLDRLSRLKYEDTYDLIRRLIQSGVSIAVVHGDKLYPARHAIPLWEVVPLLMEADAANKEASKLGQRVALGKAIKRSQRKAEGTSSRHMIPPWCDLDENNRAVVTPALQSRAATVLGWFEATRDGVGTGELARRMEKSGTRPWGKARIWHRTFISKTLANRSVLGEFQPIRMVGGRKEPIGEPWVGHFPAIVPHDLFEEVNRSAADRRRAWGGRKSTRLSNLFAGMTVCGVCEGSVHFKTEAAEGSKVRSSNGKVYTVRRDRGQFVCSTARVSGGVKCQNRSAWSYITFEDAVIRALLPLAMDDQAFSNRSAVNELRETIAERNRKLEVVSLKARNLWDEWSENPSPTVKDLATRADSERQLIEGDLAVLREQFDQASGRVSAAEHIARVQDVAAALYEPNMERRLATRRKVMVALNGLIDRIAFHPDRASLFLKQGYGANQTNVGLLLIDRKGNVRGWNLNKESPIPTPYEKRLRKVREQGNSPLIG